MTKRREFTRDQREQIVERAKANGVVYCEGCSQALKPGCWEIDHVIAEGLRPDADKTRKLTIAEGQLLGKCCHRGEGGKTNKDVTLIAKAKRQYNGANGIKTASAKSIRSAGFPTTEKAANRQPKDVLPQLQPRQLYREDPP